MMMTFLFNFFLFLMVGDAQAFTAPPIGSLCPPGYVYDGANCFRGKPTGATSFIYQNGFYHQGSQCQLGAQFDSANCFLEWIPWNYEGFIYKNGWYVKPLPHFVGKTTKCPTGLSFDGANCFYANPPGGREAQIKYGNFAFKRNFYQSCENIIAGAWGLVDPFWCAMKKVPEGHEGFVYNNAWYTKTTPGAPDIWSIKDERNHPDSYATAACLPYQSSMANWSLIWSDEFNDIPENTRCYNSTSEVLQCVYKAWWGNEPCRDGPSNWTTSGSFRWTQKQIEKYVGLRNLNKCRWQVFDSYNNWEIENPLNLRKNSYSPGNISINNGTLKMVTKSNPGLNFDCGRPTAVNPSQDGEEYTKLCPYSGANIQTATNLPWTATNSPSNNDPNYRYVGFSSGYGRYEFKARIKSIGHGAWPALWMFYDNGRPNGQGGIELDALEFLADLRGSQSGFEKNVTYGLAHQTAHNWGGNGSGLTHHSAHVGTPLSKLEWYTFSVEWESDVVRFYINNCLRKVFRDGDQIRQDDGSFITFHVPRDQNISLLIGNPASSASWLPAWYRADANGGPEPRSDFKPTELEVDYIRVYGVKKNQVSGSSSP
jgi:hypothetical protein